jgi:transposase
MLELIKSNTAVYDNYKIAQSVPGVGKVIAIAFICATNNFNKFESAKALGSYCGVVPFGKESGRYKGKDKVSPIANKTLKTLLHLGALASIRAKMHLQYITKEKSQRIRRIKCLPSTM